MSSSTNKTNAFISMIPFTKANRDAKEAESAMNDYSLLEREKEKVNEIFELLLQSETNNGDQLQPPLCKDGVIYNNDVLKKLLKDTDKGLSYFNRIKTEIEKEKQQQQRETIENNNAKEVTSKFLQSDTSEAMEDEQSKNLLRTLSEKLHETISFLKNTISLRKIDSSFVVRSDDGSKEAQENMKPMNEESINSITQTQIPDLGIFNHIEGEEYHSKWDELQEVLRDIVMKKDSQKHLFLIENDCSSSAGHNTNSSNLVNRSSFLTCQWRGKNEDGICFTCTNYSVISPWETQVNVYGAIIPRRTFFCAYHSKFCVDINQRHLPENFNDSETFCTKVNNSNEKTNNHPVKIRNRNKLALCNECYVQAMQEPPPKLLDYRIPGIKRHQDELHNQEKKVIRRAWKSKNKHLT